MLLLSSVWFGAVERRAAQSQRGRNVEEGDITRLTHFTAASWKSLTIFPLSFFSPIDKGSRQKKTVILRSG